MKKLNIYTDCSFKNGGQICGFGIVAYLGNRKCFTAIVPKKNVLSSTNGETLAAFEGLKMALPYKDDFTIVLNTDCEHVFFIFAEIKHVKEDENLVGHILEVKKQFKNIEVKLVKRDKNKEADKLAFHARKLLSSAE